MIASITGCRKIPTRLPWPPVGPMTPPVKPVPVPPPELVLQRVQVQPPLALPSIATMPMRLTSPPTPRWSRPNSRNQLVPNCPSLMMSLTTPKTTSQYSLRDLNSQRLLKSQSNLNQRKRHLRSALRLFHRSPRNQSPKASHRLPRLLHNSHPQISQPKSGPSNV